MLVSSGIGGLCFYFSLILDENWLELLVRVGKRGIKVPGLLLGSPGLCLVLLYYWYISIVLVLASNGWRREKGEAGNLALWQHNKAPHASLSDLVGLEKSQCCMFQFSIGFAPSMMLHSRERSWSTVLVTLVYINHSDQKGAESWLQYIFGRKKLEGGSFRWLPDRWGCCSWHKAHTLVLDVVLVPWAWLELELLIWSEERKINHVKCWRYCCVVSWLWEVRNALVSTGGCTLCSVFCRLIPWLWLRLAPRDGVGLRFRKKRFKSICPA